MSTPNVRLHELLDFIRNGRIMDAMREFYADDVVMSEPAYGDTVGLAANLEREEKFVASVAEFKNFETPAVAVSGTAGLYENVMDWTDVNGNDIHVEQTVVQQWKDGKIVSERFYYDTGNA
ncbi:SnoaL-like domain-containing protein [Algisphaera agarilytica]|uniref:Ketosteroid isomerase-like protein n=1 Tax=Algisphaera agarilytica TaxID=1385975 RepID=A0A7X0H6G4_9BACT|nr:SnoaL-like domain-containing protein [Algisphaera agarilytica]MBB6430163.1 ketosteroid isomerase-like protein [Algisphaera agarilytica]